MATTNFNWTEMTAAQANPETTINTTFAEMEASISAVLATDITSSNARTLTAAEFRENAVFVVDEDGGDPAVGAITLTTPTTKRGGFTVQNDTAFAVTVTIAAQSKTAPVVAAGTIAILDTDGVDIQEPS